MAKITDMVENSEDYWLLARRGTVVNHIAKKKTGKGAIICCVFGMLVNIIWRERNRIRFQAAHYYADMLYRKIALHMHITGRGNTRWQTQLQQLNKFP